MTNGATILSMLILGLLILYPSWPVSHDWRSVPRWGFSFLIVLLLSFLVMMSF